MSVTHKFQPAAFMMKEKGVFPCNMILSHKLLCPKRGLFLLHASTLRYIRKPRNQLLFLFPALKRLKRTWGDRVKRKCIRGNFLWDAPYTEGIQDSLGSWIPRCGFRITGTGFLTFGPWNVDSGIQWVVGFRIPKTRISDSTSKNFSKSGIRIPLYDTIWHSSGISKQ